MVNPEDVLTYWLDEVGQDGWYMGGDALDADIRDKFHETWKAACEGALSLWLTYPSGTLAYIILTDQFPRNMFRGSADAFATDAVARAAAKSAIAKGWDMRIDEPARQFFYLPLMHSECLSDQERSVRLILTRMPNHGESNLLHAKAHREVIRKFGRFPYRNEALDRSTQPSEQAYLNDGGYGSTVRELQAAVG
ncbi:MAG: DUF924 family protein [Pseudomonadota bacterium]